MNVSDRVHVHPAQVNSSPYPTPRYQLQLRRFRSRKRVNDVACRSVYNAIILLSGRSRMLQPARSHCIVCYLCDAATSDCASSRTLPWRKPERSGEQDFGA